MEFNRQNEFVCQRCQGTKFLITRGPTCVYVRCAKCDDTDEISRRRLGWED